jgi:dihydroneopterin aldolase
VPDQIVIEQLELSARIGVPEEERATAQRLTANLLLEPRHDFSALDDRIENTVDYFILTRRVQEIALVHPLKLLETLAEKIAVSLLAEFPLARVTLELRKYILKDAKFVAVRIERSASPLS